MCGPVARLTLVFLAVKVVQLVLVVFTPVQFDVSTQLLVSQNTYPEAKDAFVNKVLFGDFLLNLQKLISWDVVYFNDLAVNGLKYEHQFVFCPLWWRTIQYISGKSNYYTSFMVSLLLTNVLHYLDVLLVYFYTRRVFSSGSFFNVNTVSYVSALTYVVSPAAMFMTAPYSEAACAFFSLTVLYLREVSLNYQDFRTTSKVSVKHSALYLLSGISVALCYGMRANGVLLGLIYIYDLVLFSTVNKNIRDSILAIGAGSVLFIGLFVSNLYPYLVFCLGGSSTPWCNSVIPSLFSYAQKEYWNVGFLKYWTPNNIPNFLFAMPAIVLSVYSFRLFLVQFPMAKLIPILLVNGALLAGALGWWHVQIFNRISSFLPVLNWTVAIVVVSGNKNMASLVTGYLVVWNIIHSTLFAAFLPPA